MKNYSEDSRQGKKNRKGCCNKKDNVCNDSDKAPPAQRTASDFILKLC